MTRARHLGCGGLAAWIVVVAGCSEELGPEVMPTTRVTGVVREGRRPVGGGWVEFFPADGTVGNLCTAPIRADGTFTAEGVAVGTNRISVVHAPVDPLLGRLFTMHTTPILRPIPGGRASSLEIDLIAEAVRRQSGDPETTR